MFEPEKPQKSKPQAELLLDLMRDYCFQRASSAQIWACFPKCRDHGRWLWPLRSPHFRTWITNQFFRRHQFYPSPFALRYAIRLMETMGRDFNSDPALRVSGDARHHIALDIANHDGAAVEITAEGWTLNPSFDTYSFYRPETGEKLREPAGPGHLEPLRDLIRPATHQDWLRLQAWLLTALRPQGPYPILVLQGPEQCGKTTAARIIRALIDPATTPFTPMPPHERRLLSYALHTRILAFDQVRALPTSMADAFCRLSSGAAHFMQETTTSDLLTFHLQRPIMMTVPDTTTWKPTPELSARMWTVKIQPIQPTDRRPESEIQERYEQAHPAILAALCEAVSTAIRRQKEVEQQGTDVEIWAQAAAPSLRTTEEEIKQALRQPNQFQTSPDLLIDQIEDLLDRTPNQEWNGTPTELLNQLPPGNRPASPNHLGTRLAAIKPNLEARGIDLSQTKTNQKRQIHLKKRPPASPAENPLSPCHPEAPTGTLPVAPSPSLPVVPTTAPNSQAKLTASPCRPVAVSQLAPSPRHRERGTQSPGETRSPEPRVPSPERSLAPSPRQREHGTQSQPAQPTRTFLSRLDTPTDPALTPMFRRD